MKTIYPKFILVFILLIVTFIINFRFHNEPLLPKNQPVPQQIKKVIVVKKVYIRVPMAKDSTQSDTTAVITLPKQIHVPDYTKYRRSKNLHKNIFIS